MHFAELEVVGVGMMFVEVVLVAVYEIVFLCRRRKHFARSEVAGLPMLLVEVELVVIVFPCHWWPFLVEVEEREGKRSYPAILKTIFCGFCVKKVFQAQNLRPSRPAHQLPVERMNTP
jgi:hypothetical protein